MRTLHTCNWEWNVAYRTKRQNIPESSWIEHEQNLKCVQFGWSWVHSPDWTTSSVCHQPNDNNHLINCILPLLMKNRTNSRFPLISIASVCCTHLQMWIAVNYREPPRKYHQHLIQPMEQNGKSITHLWHLQNTTTKWLSTQFPSKGLDSRPCLRCLDPSRSDRPGVIEIDRIQLRTERVG